MFPYIKENEMSQTIVVEAVNTKPKFPKYSNGSVLANGTWMQVAKNIDIALFQKDTQIQVETKTNDKGYVSIVGVAPTAVLEKPKAVATKIEKAAPERATTSYDTDKNRRILVQGVFQAAAQAPSLAGLPFTSVDDVANNVIQLADRLIEAIDKRLE